MSMQDNLRDKGIYFGGIGLLLTGIALIIWSVTQIASVIISAQRLRSYYSASTERIAFPSQKTASPTQGTTDIQRIVNYLVNASTNPSAKLPTNITFNVDDKNDK